MDYCRSCESRIENTLCDCGYWFRADHPQLQQFEIYKQALLAFQKQEIEGILPSIFSADLGEKNIQVLFFTGTSQELEMLINHLNQIKSKL